jgi:hypothetical protein
MTIGITACIGCGGNNASSRFVKIETGFSHDIEYDKESKVMYIIGAYGNATVMLDSDGKPLLYKGE